jgi:hypothetical protein|tara:strand:- start:240 stop:344 length:105 start_codon:yes stop_codon:yes gene_type:complete
MPDSSTNNNNMSGQKIRLIKIIKPELSKIVRRLK